MGKDFWYVALVVAALHIVAQWAAEFMNNDRPLVVASLVTGILGFLWVLSWGQWREPDPGRYPNRVPMTKEAALRAAIAGGIVLQYLSIVATVSFFGRPQENVTVDPVAQTFITSFTTVVAVVIAFYFGASAYVEGKRNPKAKSDSDT